MVTNSLPTRHLTPLYSWQQQLAAAIRDPQELLRRLGLDPALVDPGALAQASAQFPLLVPESFLKRMRPADPADPLLRQVLPLGAELQRLPGYSADPLGEAAARKAPGLLQKYQGRALLVTTGACAVHCRYCFRREFDYSAEAATGEGRWRAALAQLAQDPRIEEVILSGGDPLSLSNARLEALLQSLDELPQVRRLRIHTRTPIVLPARVDAGLLELLRRRQSRLVIVVHANHAQEIDTEVALALRALGGACAQLLNQSVLLAGVNDTSQALARLSEALFEAGTLPYYLHLLDPVHGTAHFEVPQERAQALLRTLHATLSGYLVPRLVREVAGMPGKVPVSIGTGFGLDAPQ